MFFHMKQINFTSLCNQYITQKNLSSKHMNDIDMNFNILEDIF